MNQNESQFLAELRAAFRAEADEHLNAITAGLLDLEKEADAARRGERFALVFREVHSLKGAARAVNAGAVESVCQALEGAMAVLKRRGQQPTPETFDILQAAVSRLTTLLGDGREESARFGPSGAGDEELIRLLGELERSAGGASGGANEASQRSSPPVGDARASSSSDAAPARAERLTATPAATTTGDTTAAAEGTAGRRSAGSESLRISVAKLDAVLLQAEELLAVKLTVGQRASELRLLSESLERWSDEWRAAYTSPGEDAPSELRPQYEARLHVAATTVRSLLKAAEHDRRSTGALIDTLLENAKKLLMLPIATALDALPKLVRDLSRDERKEVDLLVSGADVEVDKRILDEMKDPLIHLLRNCIDHGIESPERRVAAGKPGRGTIRVDVSQAEGSKVQILVSDDGAGLDRRRIVEAAVKRNVVSSDQAAALDDAGAAALIFQPEVSTRDAVSEISGRGLGMSIVKEKVEALAGQVTVESATGGGTAFRILLPLTLATFRGILVRAADQVFVIPTVNVERVTRVRREDIGTVENRDVVRVNGRPVALARLGDVLELPGGPASGWEEGGFFPIAVIAVGERRVAFAVDAVLNEQEVLVKPFGRPLSRVRNVSGATVLGHGKPVSVLNPADLVRSAARAGGAPGPARVSTSTQAAAPRRPSILVAEDSITARMLLKNILESNGFAVTTAVDGVDALTALRTGHFDLVVTDVEMPRMDGFELTERVRATKELADLPVVLVTALGSAEHRERGVEAGANAYIVKSSFDQGNLLEAVRRLL